MKPRTLCCYALPIPLPSIDTIKVWECTNCGLATRHIGNKKAYYKVLRALQEWHRKAPPDPKEFMEYLSHSINPEHERTS